MSYPDNNPKTVQGLKKPTLVPIPPAALIHLGRAMQNGAVKYGRMNWRTNSVAATIYYDAVLRHMLAWLDGEDIAEDSGVHHLAHAMAGIAIVLDALETGNLIDDRPTKGAVPRMIKELTNANG